MSKAIDKKRQSAEVTRVEPAVDTRPRVTPRAFVRETDDAFELRLELPGVAESALRLEIEQRTLTVEADRAVPAREGYRLVREEFPPVVYRAVYEVPEWVEPSGIKARLANGVLTITMPKREDVKPRRIPLETA